MDLIPCPDGTYADPAIGCVSAPAGVSNPESGLADIFLRLTSMLTSIAIAIAILILMYGGITYALAAGDPDKINKAKRLMFWSGAGLIGALLARGVVEVAVGLAG